MRHHSPALVAVALVVVSLVALPAVGLAAQTTDATDEEAPDDQSNASIAPGEQLAGVVGVQAAEIRGEVDSRAYGIRVAKAASNDSKAGVVASQLDDVEQRLTDLEQRQRSLEQARANGSLSDGQYRARMARLAAETQTVERLANQTNATAQTLPAATLEANGVNATAIDTLRTRASELRGPEVAAIARSIAGQDAGKGLGPEHAREHRSNRGNQSRDGASRAADEGKADGEGSAGRAETSSQTTTETRADDSERSAASDGQAPDSDATDSPVSALHRR